MRVPYVDFQGQFANHKSQILELLQHTLESGKYILSDELENFERNFAKFCNVKHCIGVADGTDALILAMKALDIGSGDEVITASNSWISSASSIVLAGATPVFVDVGPDQNIDHTASPALAWRLRRIPQDRKLFLNLLMLQKNLSHTRQGIACPRQVKSLLPDAQSKKTAEPCP